MAGFFGMFNYSKPGKGVDKGGPQKKRFFFFWELFFRKFWKMITLNLLYLLFCIPIVTIGPATSALTYILKNFALERPVFLWTDFVKAFKENWKKSFVLGLIDAILIVVLVMTSSFYIAQAADNMLFYIPLVIVYSVGFILLLASMYMFIMIPILDMKFKPMFKNALLLSFLGIKTNIITAIFLVLLTLVSWIIFPFSILLWLVIFFSLFWFIAVFNSFQYIEKFIIDPYYEKTGEKRPDVLDLSDMEEEEFVFQDIGTEEKAANIDKKPGGRVIK